MPLLITITTLVNNSGVQPVLQGSAINTGVNNTRKLYNIQGTISETVTNNGRLLVAGGIGNGIAYNSDTLINSGGQVVIGSNMLNRILGSAIDYNARIYGSQTVLSGSIASNATIFNGGYQDIKNGGHVFATVVSSGGLLNTENGATISGTITVEVCGSATIYNDAGYALGTASDGNLTYEVCFLTGTMIKILDGEKAIEGLRIGDFVCTFDWKHNKKIVRPICWIGNQKTTVKLNDTPGFAGYPVRIIKECCCRWYTL